MTWTSWPLRTKARANGRPLTVGSGSNHCVNIRMRIGRVAGSQAPAGGIRHRDRHLLDAEDRLESLHRDPELGREGLDVMRAFGPLELGADPRGESRMARIKLA